ncbi:MAG: Crp/Fnr family transcriptional regulator [Armatimonadota bacterium]|nr:Crp/Fnr family transcriptional regulator [Armatimonadota bacterium]
MERREALRRVRFLKALPEETLATIAAAGQERALRKGEELFGEASPCLGLIVVLSGSVRIFKIDARGRELTLGTEQSGESVAELPLFDGGNYPANAEAVEDGTSVLIVPRERFRALMASHPPIAEEALRALATRMRGLVALVEAQTMHSVRVRLAAYLLHAAGGQGTFRLTETNDQIASRIGSVRDVVSRMLGSFKEEGALTVEGRQVTLNDGTGLRRIVELGGRQPPES